MFHQCQTNSACRLERRNTTVLGTSLARCSQAFLITLEAVHLDYLSSQVGIGGLSLSKDGRKTSVQVGMEEAQVRRENFSHLRPR